MQITIDTNNLTELDRAILSFVNQTPEEIAAALAGEDEVVAEPDPPAKPAKKAAATKKAAAPEPEEDLLGGSEPEPSAEGPTLADAVSAATAMVSDGKSAKVKEALASVQAKRVSEVEPENVAAFLAALDG